MINRYSRFKELKTKAKLQLGETTVDDKKIINALNEIFYMLEDEIPEHSKQKIKEIKEMSSLHKPQNPDDGIVPTTIKKMNVSEKKVLIRLIKSL